MKYNFFSKSMVLGTIILLFGANFIVGNVPGISKTIDNENIRQELDSISEYLISYEKAQEMIESQNAILLYIHENYITNQINGVISVTMSDLECGSCIENMLRNYETIIVYSENNELIVKASNILSERNYIVYELADNLPSDGFPLAYLISDTNNGYDITDIINEEYSLIRISNSAARVIAYKREGQIKRLYGEAFSFGESPEESADNFLQYNANLFGIDPTDLNDLYLQPIMYNSDAGEYKFTSLNYIQCKNDIPVFRSRLILLLKNKEGYPLVSASVDLRDLGDFTPIIKQDKFNPEEGINRALMKKPNLVQFTHPELVIWAGINDMVVEPRMAYSFIGDNGYQNGDSSPEKYLFVTDAETGDILYIENLIIFVDVTGNVQGRATQENGPDICEDEVAEDLMWARVNIGSTYAFADEDGDFTIPNSGSSPVTVESRLWGKWFRVYNQAGADTVISKTVNPPGPANFMHNNQNTEEFKRAEVNGYYQANIVRDFTLTYNPDYPGLDQNEFPVNVNINDNCNAYYDYSSINFYRAGGSCPNTAFSTVIHHEYGHHLVAMAGSGQGEYGEGMGDVMGVLITDDSGLAYGFYGDCDTPLRNADNDLQYPCSGEIHYCGQLLSGCVWDTRNELKSNYPSSYLEIISNLAINAMLLHTGDKITPSITIDYLVLDDDNENIYDGTPHYWEIADGFGAHNMDAPELALLAFEFPDGLPDIIFPSGETTLKVIVKSVTGDPEPNTGIMHFNDGSGWVEIPMTETEPNHYDVVFPGGECQNQVSFYFTAETTDGKIQFWPTGAPDEVYKSVYAYDIEIKISDDFENDLGWTVENDPYLTTGAWERGVPEGGGVRGDPPNDHDGSGQCYLTDNRYGDSDIDDGITWLISPTIDLSDVDNAIVQYSVWYTNNYGNDPNNDLFKIYVSNDNGDEWELVEIIGPVTSSGWKVKTFMVGEFVTPTDEVKVRFEASDLNEGSVVEAGIDAFSVIIFDCEPPPLPDLTCEANLQWDNVKAGETIKTTIDIKNMGDPDSLLDWEIIECPMWCKWTFSPSSGDDLTPEDGAFTVEVEVEAPDQTNEEFVGEVKITNKEDPNDFDIIPVLIKTPRNRVSNTFLLQLFQQISNRFAILLKILGL